MHYVRCRVSLGFFETELYIVVNDSSAFVDRKNVRVQHLPGKDSEVEGLVLVSVISEEGDKALVELPGQPVVGGLRTWVPRANLEPVQAVA
jgi:hypothetical protein